jgi:hypothetical protein
MISVPTDNYYVVLRAAQLQAAREGAPSDTKQSVSIAVEEQPTPPAPQTVDAAVRQVVDVLV